MQLYRLLLVFYQRVLATAHSADLFGPDLVAVSIGVLYAYIQALLTPACGWGLPFKPACIVITTCKRMLQGGLPDQRPPRCSSLHWACWHYKQCNFVAALLLCCAPFQSKGLELKPIGFVLSLR